MRPKPISKIIAEAAAAPKREDKIAILRGDPRMAKFNFPIREYLRMAVDKKLVWDIPPGTPPYKPCIDTDNESVLYRELRRMYIFHRGGQPNLRQAKRELLFITLLESMPPEDAEFLINVVKDRKLPKGLTEKTIKEAIGI